MAHYRHRRVSGRSSVLSSLWIAAIIGGWAAPSRADVTGKWVANPQLGGAPQTFDITQSGTSLAIGYALPFTGSINPSTGGFGASYSFPGGAGAGIAGIFLAAETRFVAETASYFPPSFLDYGILSGMRCECFDGNTTHGDGCNDRCQVEPCYTCTGFPSTCTPSGDGAACDDRNACTAGETCSSGTCGGGSKVTPCINLAGSWSVRQAYVYAATQTLTRAQIAQVGSTLEVGGTPTSLPPTFGTIDTLTGAFTTYAGVPSFGCPSISVVSATAASDSNSYQGTNVLYEPVADYCLSHETVITAWRCGSGTVDPGEQCDDGNGAGGDGCSTDCQLETCLGQPNGTPCDAGDPCFVGDTCQNSVCTPNYVPAPSGTPCDDGISCTVGDSCSDGVCQAGGSSCGTCEICSAALGCATAPDYTACSDGVSCTSGDRCIAGACQGGSSNCGQCQTCAGAAGCMPLADGTACDDGLSCTAGDACVAGACKGSCAPCMSCERGPGGCRIAPRATCEPLGPGRSATLAVRDPFAEEIRALSFRWSAKNPTAATFGAPRTTDDYGICVFDASSPSNLKFRAIAPAGGTCGRKPCWTATSSASFRYHDVAGTPDGIGLLSLRKTRTGATRLALSARGPLLTARPFGLPFSPAPVPLLVQLQSDGGACFEAAFDADDVVRNVQGSLRLRAH